MYLIYIDEAGNTGDNLRDPQQPYHVVVALPVPENRWREIEARMAAIAQAHIPEPDRATFEFHAGDLHQGARYFRKWGAAARRQIAMDILGVLTEFGLHVLYGACDKPRLAARYSTPAHPHDLAFLLAAERCERYLADEGGGQLGMFIADQYRDRERHLHTSLRYYREHGIPLGYRSLKLEHVIEDIHFQSSQASCFLQLADFCAYYVKRALVRGDWSDERAQLVLDRVSAYRVFP